MSRNVLLLIIGVLVFILLFGDDIRTGICTKNPTFFICQATMSVQADPVAEGTQYQIRAFFPNPTNFACILFAIGFIMTAFLSGDLRNWGIGLGSMGLLIWVLDFLEIL